MTTFENVEVSIWEKVWLRLFLSHTFSHMDTPTFSNVVILHLPVYEDGTDRVFQNVGI
jgi:hypothetical protein